MEQRQSHRDDDRSSFYNDVRFVAIAQAVARVDDPGNGDGFAGSNLPSLAGSHRARGGGASSEGGCVGEVEVYEHDDFTGWRAAFSVGEFDHGEARGLSGSGGSGQAGRRTAPHLPSCLSDRIYCDRQHDTALV